MPNISSTLPADIPAPKFNLFDYVHVNDPGNGCSCGYITGLEYTTWEQALIGQFAHYGWSYTINFVYGKSKQDLLKVNEATDEHWEDRLELIQPVSGGVS